MSDGRTWAAVAGVCFVMLAVVTSVSLVARYAQDPSAPSKRAFEQANREILASVDKASRRVEQELRRAKREAAATKAALERLEKAKALAAEQSDRSNKSLVALQTQRDTAARELESRQRTLSALTQGRPQVLGVAPIPHTPQEIEEGQKISQLSRQVEQLQLSIDQQLARQQQTGASIKSADSDLAKTKERAARSKLESDVWADVLSQLMTTKPALQTSIPEPARADPSDQRTPLEEKWVPFWTTVIATVGAVFATCIGAGVAVWAITTKREGSTGRTKSLVQAIRDSLSGFWVRRLGV